MKVANMLSGGGLEGFRRTLLMSILSGLLGAVLVIIPTLWQISITNSTLEGQRQQIDIMKEQMDIMNRSLERRANLIMTVLPAYSLTVTGYNATVEISNGTLTVSRTQDFYFTMYVSNVGDGFAHLLYYAVIINCEGGHTVTSVSSMKPVVLSPSESTSFDWTFVPSSVPFETNLLNFTFVLGSAEASLNQTIYARW